MKQEAHSTLLPSHINAAPSLSPLALSSLKARDIYRSAAAFKSSTLPLRQPLLTKSQFQKEKNKTKLTLFIMENVNF